MKYILKNLVISGLMCLLITVAYTQPNITRVEYYIDADPGFGNATEVSISASTDIQNKIIPIDPASVSEGVHRFYVRAKDANGNWSLTNTLLFYKPYGGGDIPAAPAPPTSITRVEYYIDTDPGFGNATNVGITASADIQNTIIALDPTPLAEGVHRFYVRAKNANGNWSLTNTLLFYKPYGNTIPPAAAIAKMNKLEYYIDTDPGYGNGVPVALDNLADFADYIVPINVTGLAIGDHTFWVRGLDKNGNWSMMNSWAFTVPAVIATPSIVVNSITDITNCARDSFDISYDVTGTYNAGNTFNVELSDASGNFGSPTIIGSYTGTVNSIIKIKLPSHSQEGTNYKLRVSSTNPVVTGIANATAVTIHDRPVVQTITGASDVNATFSYPYSVPTFSGSTWTWIVPAATIAQTTNSANLLWNTQGQPQMMKIVETNQYGCVGDTSTKAVNVYNLKIDNVASSSLIPCPSGNITVTGNATGVYDAGNVFTAQLSDASGSFASPVNIGTATASPVGLSQPVSINATLPFPLANGTGYRVRINANLPAVTGSDNGQDISVNKPDLGVDKAVSKCVGFTTDISSVFVTTGLTVQWNTGDASSVDVGTYQLIVTNANGCKDTANVMVTNYPKPDIGADKSTTISCANGTADITTVYGLSGLTATYNTATPATAPVGNYTIIVTNINGCKDTAGITVMDASTATVPALGSNIKAANRECTDANGWTHYYNDNGTPTDYSNDIRLLSLKKNGNNIGTVGDGTFQLKVAATTGAGTNHAVNVNSNLVPATDDFYSMNRYWDITPTTQPTSAVGVRFYYNTQDLADVNGDYPGGSISHAQLSMYKLVGGNPDPTSDWAGATGITYYTAASMPSDSEWVYTDLGNNRHQAEYMVNSFSGGGGGAVATGALPVTFISFTVTAQKDKVVLQWSTATELNSKDFSIQRSLDGSNFETIGIIPAAGNSSTLRNYSFDDIQSAGLKGRVIFYKIMENDLDGKSFYTDVKKVKIADGKNKFTLVYNPVRNEALFNYECTERTVALIRVADHLGRIVLTKQIDVIPGMNQIRLQTSPLAKGIYEVELRSNKNQYHVRMMKE